MIKSSVQQLLLCFILLLSFGCASEWSPDPVDKTKTSPGGSPEQLIEQEALDQAAPSSVDSTDSNLFRIAEHVKERGYSLQGLRTWHRFDLEKDSILVPSKNLLIFAYAPSDVIAFYQTHPSVPSETRDDDKLQSIDLLMLHLQAAKCCLGIEYSEAPNTVFNMVQSWEFSTTQEAQTTDSLFKSTHFQLFPKTLSFSTSDSHYFYIFHSRYMAASYELKLDFEWFEQQL
jgi:hypothetical protein